ncbi:MAG: tetratricopeptide repeat protein [Gammaproteobacteria bacterium]|jgi:putative thioredoxin
MAKLDYVFDGTRDNFEQLVIANSHKGLVLANYWTPGAAPCFKLWHDLEKLSQEFQGRFLLVNINTDSQKWLAREKGITSVPTIKLYRNGVVVESVYGAYSEASLRATIEKHAPVARPPEVIRAIRAYQAGQPEDALKILVNAGIREPGNAEVHATAVRLLLREGRYADIESYVAHLPEAVRALPDIDRMRTHAHVLRLAADAPSIETLEARLEKDPDDPEAGLQRIALAVTADDHRTAFEGLLHQLSNARQTDRGFLHKIVRNLFALLGEENELARHYTKLYRERLRANRG